MSSLQELFQALHLLTVNTDLPRFFSYFAPWISLATSVLALVILFIPKRSDETPIRLILKIHYIILLLYSLNMLFNDPQFSQPLFRYIPNFFVPDGFCKVQYVVLRYIYYLSPWMSMAITFDRIWSAYLSNKITRKKSRVVVLITILLGFAFIVSLLNGVTYLKAIPRIVTIATMNGSMAVTVTVYQCLQENILIVMIQDTVFLLMRVILPFLVILLSNFILIKNVYGISKRTGQNNQQKREDNFTKAVFIINFIFVLLNLPFFVSFILTYYLKLSGILDYYYSLLSQVQILLFQTIAVLLSYILPLFYFWADLAFNRVFRGEIKGAFLAITGNGNSVGDSPS